MSTYTFDELVEEISEKNDKLDFGLDDIVGVTLDKELIPTIANLSQTALDKFYIVKPETFVYNPRTHGVRLGMGYNYSDKTFITTWNNIAFRVKDSAKEILNPYYLYLYFKRENWDREANFNAWGSSTIVFAWKIFLNLKIDLPDKRTQDKIVRQYQVIEKRIGIKRRINDNLLKTATALYKSWFVELTPFEGVVPESWIQGTVEDIAEIYDSQRKPLSGMERDGMEKLYPYYGAVSIVDYVDDFLFNGEYILLSEDGIYVVDENGHPLLQHVTGRFWVNNHAHIMKGKNGFSEDSLFLFLSDMNMAPIVTGAAQPKINQANLRSFPTMIPDMATMLRFNKLIAPAFNQRISNEAEIIKLEALKGLLLSKLVS